MPETRSGPGDGDGGVDTAGAAAASGMHIPSLVQNS